MIWKHHRFQEEFKNTSDSEHRASVYRGTGIAAKRPAHISYITCTLIEIIGTWFFSFSHKGYTITIYPSGLECQKRKRKRKKIGVHEHTGDVPRKLCPLPDALQEPRAQGSRCNHFSSNCMRRGEHAVGLAGLTTRGSNRMYAPKRPRPGGVLTEWAEDFPVHHFSKFSARMLCLKNSSPSPLCLLYSKVKKCNCGCLMATLTNSCSSQKGLAPYVILSNSLGYLQLLSFSKVNSS